MAVNPRTQGCQTSPTSNGVGATSLQLQPASEDMLLSAALHLEDCGHPVARLSRQSHVVSHWKCGLSAEREERPFITLQIGFLGWQVGFWYGEDDRWGFCDGEDHCLISMLVKLSRGGQSENKEKALKLLSCFKCFSYETSLFIFSTHLPKSLNLHLQ